jgi:hypothetical protein
MKKLIILTTIIIFTSFMMSCNKEKEIAYYRFTSVDTQRILPYTEGQVLKFMNQSNDERNFTIHSISTSLKKRYTVGMGFFSSEAASYFYYDSKYIALVDSKMEQPFNINFLRWPLETELAKENIYTEYPSNFFATIQYMRFWNGGDAEIDYEQRKIEMIVAGKTYKNVFVLISGNNSIIEYPWSDGTTQIRDVNVIYYDAMEGIIGFDDLNGNEWRLIN